MKHAVIAAVLVASLVTTGCLGTVKPATIEAQKLSNHGWELKESKEQDLAMGLGQLVQRSYAPTSAAAFDTNSAGVTVATVTNFPIVDETRFLPDAIDQVAANLGVTFTETGSRDMQLVQLESVVAGTTYRIDGAAVPGEAVVLVAPCDDFVVVVPWGASENTGGIFGGGVTPFETAIDVARAVMC